MRRELVWPQSDIDRMLELRRAGLSATIIGYMMGRSRNSILGKIERLRLAGYEVPPSTARTVRPSRPPKPVPPPPTVDGEGFPLGITDEERLRWRVWKRATEGAREALGGRA